MTHQSESPGAVAAARGARSDQLGGGSIGNIARAGSGGNVERVSTRLFNLGAGSVLLCAPGAEAVFADLVASILRNRRIKRGDIIVHTKYGRGRVFYVEGETLIGYFGKAGKRRRARVALCARVGR